MANRRSKDLAAILAAGALYGGPATRTCLD